MTRRVTPAPEATPTTASRLLVAGLTALTLAVLLWIYFSIDISREFPFRSAAYSVVDQAAIGRRDGARRELSSWSAELRRHRAAKPGFDAAQRRQRAARRELGAATPPAQVAEGRRVAADALEHEKIDALQRNSRLVSFERRVVFMIVLLFAVCGLLAILRARRSRWALLAVAPVLAVLLLGLIMGVDYATEYVDFV